MEASAGLVTGSQSKQLIVIPGADRVADGVTDPMTMALENGARVCQICADEVGTTQLDDGKLFVACDECAFPVCRPCYEYERSEGNQSCPHCKTRYKHHKGSPRVEGDEMEDEDLDRARLTAETMLRQHMSVGRAQPTDDHSLEMPREQQLQAEFHAIVVPPASSASGTTGGGGKRVHPLPHIDQAQVSLFTTASSRRNAGSYGYGTVSWKERLDSWKARKEKYQMVAADDSQVSGGDHGDERAIISDLQLMDESRQPLSRKVSVPSSLINPYRLVIVIRLVVLGFFFRYRITNPVENAFALWLTAVICEVWFALSWILDQFPKWHPVHRETYLDRLALRYEREGEPSRLAPVDVFVSTVDPIKEPPLVMANTVLSVLSVDYPVDKLSCYVSDDGAEMLTFEALSETSEFARKWVPFCKRFSIEPRAPEVYFAQKIDYLKDRVQPSFVKERRAMKREYEEFKVRVNALVAKADKIPEEGWSMYDGTPWPGNNTRDHPGMIQVFLGQSGGHDSEGNELPRLVYISREKRPGFNHHQKAGAMNALVRVSAVLTNAPFVLNLDYDHYVNNTCALREAMCFMMDPTIGKKACYVQFPQRFDGVDTHDRYANHNTVFFDINLKGLDGIQGPVYVGTGTVFRRQALYGYNAPTGDKTHKLSYNLFSALCCCWRRRSKRKSKKIRLAESSDSSIPIVSLEDLERLEGPEEYKFAVDQKNFEKKYGQSPAFVTSTLMENGGVPESASPSTLLKEAIHVISCGYEDKTEWGKEIGWIYGSVTEDILTGFKMHARGWRSIYCVPSRPAFKGSAPINLSDRLQQVLRWALGSVEILFSRHCPIWYGYSGRLKWLQRLAYINAVVYPLTSIPLVAYCTLPAVCLLTGKFIIPEIGNLASMWFIAMFLSIVATSLLEMRWSGVGIEEWWRNEQFWVIGGVSSHLFAVFQGLVKVVSGIDTNFNVTALKSSPGQEIMSSELYAFKWTSLLVPPSTILVINIVGVAAGLSDAINSGYESWGPLLGKLFFALWVIIHLYPFLKGIMGRQNRTPTIVIVWSILLASIFSLLWVRVNPFLPRVVGPTLEDCGINC